MFEPHAGHRPVPPFPRRRNLAAPHPGLTDVEAALLGTIQAPTKAALGHGGVVTIQKFAVPIPQALNVENGLNDGIAFPLFLIFLQLTIEEELNSPLGASLVVSFEPIGIGDFIGPIVGLLGDQVHPQGHCAGAGNRHPLLDIVRGTRPLGVGACPRARRKPLRRRFCRRTRVRLIRPESRGESGGIRRAGGRDPQLSRPFPCGHPCLLPAGGDRPAGLLYAVLSLTRILMLPVALSVVRSDLSRETVLFMGWFGPRGLPSVVLVLIALADGATGPGFVAIKQVAIGIVLLNFILLAPSPPPTRHRTARLATRQRWSPKTGECVSTGDADSSQGSRNQQSAGDRCRGTFVINVDCDLIHIFGFTVVAVTPKTPVRAGRPDGYNRKREKGR
jgi:hypothetical protein